MVTRIPRRARLNMVLTLKRSIEHARDDLVRARHALAESRTSMRVAELATGTAEANFETIVHCYNALVVDDEPQPGRRR